jgi:spermidine synthase
LGVSIGSALFSRLHPRRAPLVFVLAAAGNCVCGLIAILLVPHLPAIFLANLASVKQSFFLQQLHQVFVGALLVLPCAVLFGLAFPAVITGATDALRAAGRGVGRVSAYNTVGTVVGAFLAGFVFVPALGLRATLTVGLMSTAAAALLALSLVPATLPTIRRGVISAVAVTLVLSLVAPSWPHQILLSGAAYFGSLGATPEAFLEGARASKLLFYEDGVATSISVDEQNGIRLYRSNGKTDASSDPGDMANQLLLGHLPMVLHPDPKDVFILGMGTGVTAAAVARYPVQSIEIVDIEPASRRAAAYFEPENRRVVSDPRTRFIAADGRNALLARGKSYDVIISDPSDVWVAGVGNLFTREFYELARDHLRTDGVMVQWFHMHALQPENMKLIVATFRSVFPDASFWRPNRGDIILVGTRNGVPWDYTRLRERFENVPGVKDDMVGAGLWHPIAMFAAFVADGAELEAMLAEIHTLHTDERPVIEFEAPRALYADTTATVDPMVQTFQKKDYPTLLNFDEKELTARDLYLFGFGYASLKRPERAIRLMEDSVRREPEGDPKFRVGLANQYRLQGNQAKARELYESALRRAPGDVEAALNLATLREETGAPDAAISVLQSAVAASPNDVELLRALGRLLHTRNRASEAVPILARAAAAASSDAGLRAAYGKALVAAGKTTEGMAELRAAHALDPTLPDVPPSR